MWDGYWFFGYPKLAHKANTRTRIFFISNQIFALFDDFSNWSAPKVKKNWPKNEQKPAMFDSFHGFFWGEDILHFF